MRCTPLLALSFNSIFAHYLDRYTGTSFQIRLLMALPSLDQVIFPEQSNLSFSRILGDLKRSNLSITNRLRSIKQDAAFVQVVGETLELPLVANERCGSWYIDPRLRTASAYFKSTDGHTGHWKFSTRRLNLHLVELAANHNGCVSWLILMKGLTK